MTLLDSMSDPWLENNTVFISSPKKHFNLNRALLKPEKLAQPLFLKSSLQEQIELTGTFSSPVAYATEQVSKKKKNHSSNHGMFLEDFVTQDTYHVHVFCCEHLFSEYTLSHSSASYCSADSKRSLFRQRQNEG